MRVIHIQMKKPIGIVVSILLIFILIVIYWTNRWNYIVIHHSAGNYGNIPFLQKVHRERQPKDPIDDMPYHYIIGNGKGLEIGKIASSFRLNYSIWGSHLSANNVDRNFRGIGICLIGNYEINKVPKLQYDALVKLTRKLMTKYNIAIANISFHGKIKGESTRCPGKNFPYKQFIQDIQEGNP